MSTKSEWKKLKRINDFYTLYESKGLDDKYFCDIYQIGKSDTYDAVVTHQFNGNTEYKRSKPLKLQEAKDWCLDNIRE